MNTKALRQKILDLAIHGKLVPQDPNDEPASVLLERIKAEKERLIKEGKIKRTKRSKAACDKPHYPYELPKGWCWTTLGDIAESNIGLTYKPSDICLDGIPVYRSNNIKNGHIDLSDVVRVNTKILEKQFLNEGDLLICARNGSRRLVGKNAIISQLDEPAAFGAFMAVCRSSYNPWICLVLNTTYFDRYLDDSNSATINQVTQSMLLAFPVPFPPKNEQDRIINEVAQLESVVANINDNIDCLNTVIKQTKSKILNLAIHGKLVPQDPTDEPAYELLKRINPNAEITCDNPQYKNLPNGWCRCTLKDIGIFESGYAFSSDEYKQNGVPLVRISNITNNGNIDLSSCVYIQNYNNSKFIIHKGDLLIAMSGATTGKMGVYKYKTEALLNQRVGNLKCTEAWLQQYRNYFMLAKSNYILNIAYGGAQPNISAKAILSIKIDLPPINEQHRIVTKIEELFTQLDNITSSL